MLLVANIILFISALLGMYLISEQDKRGFIVFLVTEASLAYIGIVTKNYGCTATSLLYLIMNIYSWNKWTRRGL